VEYVGCETASYLAKRNNRVTIVEMMESIGADIEMTSLSALRDELQRDNVTIVTGKKVDAIKESGVAVTDHQGNRTVLSMDIAVLALGVAPVDDLATQLAGKVEELYSIGDARKPAKIHDAVSDAFVLAYHL
jgi:2-enoate reductase